jgi:hypothetical protein
MGPLGIEFHKKYVIRASIVVSIQARAERVASHPGIALGIHLRTPNRQPPARLYQDVTKRSNKRK